MKTGTGNLALDLLVLLAMVLGGTVAVVWFATSPVEVQHAVINQGYKLAVFMLGQPGVVLTVWILVKSKRPLAVRVPMAIATMCVLCVIVPVAVVGWISGEIV